MPSQVQIPESSSTIDVSIVDDGSLITNMQGADYMSPVLPGYETFDGPSYAFLLHHRSSETRILFDLGMRTDWQTAYAPEFVESLQEDGMGFHVERDIPNVLREHDISPSDISTIIFSHHHFDHTGDTTKFPSSTKIIVGPCYKEAYLPGWPQDPEGTDTTSDLYENREVIEMDFSSSDPKLCTIGGFPAHDYFSDGSLYLLSTPGHTTGHLSALARTTSNDHDDKKSTFIFLGGDIVSSNGVIRPSSGLPLPSQIPASNPHTSYPASLLTKLHQCHTQSTEPSIVTLTTTPFCAVAGEEDLPQSQQNANKLRDFDGEGNIFTVWAHDLHLKDVVEFFPAKANEWKAKGWKEKAHWRWLEPCVRAVRGDVEGKGGLEGE
ncbi:MAG: hypothetical protein Q9160_005779 [Pyrenula sp. 1 TL-2023]